MKNCRDQHYKTFLYNSNVKNVANFRHMVKVLRLVQTTAILLQPATNAVHCD